MISNEEVLRRMKIKECVLYNSIVKQKLAFAGHVLRGSSGDNAVQILEGKLDVEPLAAAISRRRLHKP